MLSVERWDKSERCALHWTAQFGLGSSLSLPEHPILSIHRHSQYTCYCNHTSLSCPWWPSDIMWWSFVSDPRQSLPIDVAKMDDWEVRCDWRKVSRLSCVQFWAAAAHLASVDTEWTVTYWHLGSHTSSHGGHLPFHQGGQRHPSEDVARRHRTWHESGVGHTWCNIEILCNKHQQYHLNHLTKCWSYYCILHSSILKVQTPTFLCCSPVELSKCGVQVHLPRLAMMSSSLLLHNNKPTTWIMTPFTFKHSHSHHH